MPNREHTVSNTLQSMTSSTAVSLLQLNLAYSILIHVATKHKLTPEKSYYNSLTSVCCSQKTT